MFQKMSIGFWNKFSRSLFLTSVLLMLATTTVANQDELFSHNDQLTAKQLIKAVLARNPSIKAMQSAWQAAESRIDQVSALADPMLSYSFAPETRSLEDQDFGQKIQLSQKLPWPGKLALRGDIARFEAKATQENIELLRLQLIEVATRSFADWYYIHEALRINQINRDLWIEFRVIAELKYSTGRASKQDALRAEMEQVMLEHQAIVLQRKQRNILAQLNTLLNRAPDDIIPSPAALPEAGPLPAVGHLRKMALVAHPELKALIARQHASETQTKLAKREYYPDFNINAGYNSLWNQDEKRITVGLGINLPLNFNKRNAQLDESRAHNQKIKWYIAKKQTEIIGTVQQAYNYVEEGRHVLDLFRNKLLPLADENLHAAKADYQSGKGNFLDLVSAEKNLIQTQLNHVQARADYHRHLAMLASRIGDPHLLNGALNISGTVPGTLHSETEGESQ